jgi:hypothetical protein
MMAGEGMKLRSRAGRAPSALLAALAVLLMPWGAAADDDAAREALAQRVLQKLESYVLDPDRIGVDSATGLWKLEGGEYLVSQVAVGEVVASYGIKRSDGSRFFLGAGEGRFGRWTGYWGYSCRGCCPGRTYWGPGILEVASDRSKARIAINGAQIDPSTCEPGDGRTPVTYDLELIDMLHFIEHLPGKYVHVVYNPVDGQYKASVKIAWDAQHPGVRLVTVARPGGAIVQNSSQLSGQHEYLTDRPGEARFLLMAADSQGQPLHLELISIEIPRIGP